MFAGRIVGWRVSATVHTAFVLDAYVSIRYTERLTEAGSVGDSYDNALAETINGLYKAELIHRRSRKSREAVDLAILEWVDWFNHRRLLEPIGNIPPVKAEVSYYQQFTESAMAA